MRISSFAILTLLLCAVSPARADLHITRDHGGYVTEYKAKYERIRDRKERVIIDGFPVENLANALPGAMMPEAWLQEERDRFRVPGDDFEQRISPWD